MTSTEHIRYKYKICIDVKTDVHIIYRFMNDAHYNNLHTRRVIHFTLCPNTGGNQCGFRSFEAAFLCM